MRYVEYGRQENGFSSWLWRIKVWFRKSNQENADLVKYAYEKGINYFDTAPGYCDDRSEDIFGLAFRQMIKEGKTDFMYQLKKSQKHVIHQKKL